jgi:HEXXH motif-containing protein
MLNQHRLSGRDFDMLAAGFGSAATVASLRAAQFSRRLIGLRAVLDAADRAGYADTPGLTAGWELLRTVQQHDATASLAILGYPFVGSWVGRCLRLLVGAPNDNAPRELGYLGWVAAAAAVRAGVPFSIEVPVRDGIVCLPTLGRMLVPDLRTVNVHSDTAETMIGEMPLGERASWQELRRLTCKIDGLSLSVALDDIDPYREAPGLPLASRLSDDAVSAWQRSLSDAWRTLVHDHPYYAEAIGSALVAVVPLAAVRPDRGINATSRESFGAIAVSETRDPVILASVLVHECQHTKLNAVLDLIPLSQPDQVLYYAPWREDPRPLGGLLHGAYAYLGVSDFWRVQSSLPATSHRSYAQLEFARWSGCTARVTETLLGSGSLTEAGSRFVQRMQDRLRSWDYAVPDEPLLAARVAADDHRLGWRLRNARPNHAMIARLVDGWSAGEPTAHRASGYTEYVDGGVALGATSRLDLLHLRVRDPDGFVRRLNSVDVDGTKGDQLFAAGDLEAAAIAYRCRIRGDPTCREAWTGLALALRALRPGLAAYSLCNGPEVVYAVYNRLVLVTGEALDPEVLAEWLAPAIPADDLSPVEVSGQEAPSRTL